MIPNTNTALSTGEIIAALTKLADSDSFAASLLASHARYGHWTPKQSYWAEKLASRSLAPAPETLGDLSSIATKFETAKANGLKHPALLFFNIGGAAKVRLSLAPAGGKNPGCLYIKADGSYAGKITPEGTLHGTRLLSPAMSTFLHDFAADPAGVGAANGKAAGCCCYCSRELTDERSLSAGYGPICAKHWDLPWGKSKEITAAPAAAATA